MAEAQKEYDAYVQVPFEINEENRKNIKINKSLQRPGIEPGPPAWQARILPLNQRCLDDTLFV